MNQFHIKIKIFTQKHIVEILFHSFSWKQRVTKEIIRVDFTKYFFRWVKISRFSTLWKAWILLPRTCYVLETLETYFVKSIYSYIFLARQFHRNFVNNSTILVNFATATLISRNIFLCYNEIIIQATNIRLRQWCILRIFRCSKLILISRTFWISAL